MDSSAPYLAVLPDSTSKVLVVLARTTRPLSGREVARLSGGSRSTVARVLQRLAEQGLVNVQEAGAGAALLFTLNRRHLAAEPVLALLSLRQALIDRLRNELEAWATPPFHASLFGSVARGDGGASSDVDLFIVRPEATVEEDGGWRRQLDGLATLVFGWTGSHAGIAEIGVQELESLRRERPAIVHKLLSDAVTLAGPPAHELLGEAAA